MTPENKIKEKKKALPHVALAKLSSAEGGVGGATRSGNTGERKAEENGERNMFTSGGRGLRRSLRFPLLERLPERRRVRFPLGSPRRNMRKAHLSSSLSLPLSDLPLSPSPPPSLSLSLSFTLPLSL